MPRINRRQLLNSSAAALGSGIVLGTGTALASSDDPSWAGDGDVDDYDEFTEVVDSKKNTNQSSHENRYGEEYVYEINVKTYALEEFTNDSGDVLFHVASSAYGIGDLTWGHQGVGIDVSVGSLYSPQDRDTMAVCPDPDPNGTTDPAIDDDLAWTAAKGAISLTNPYASAGVVAADLVAAAFFKADDDSNENNRDEYNWEYTHESVNGGWETQSDRGGHVLDFFIKPVKGYYGQDYASFDMIHYFGVHDSYFDDSPQYPDSIVASDQDHYMEYWSTNPSINNSDPESSDEKEKLSEDEIESIGIPEDFRDGGDIYRSNDSTLETGDRT